MAITPITYSLHKKGENPHFEAIHLEMNDEAGGEFLIIRDFSTCAVGGEDCIRLDYSELSEICQFLIRQGKIKL